ncbi:MAG: hypothetical protein IJO21_06680 [Oscillospiraceae bacterium]|nr:hypothetical protein [Oscillospiraceae bacterium]
MVQNYCDHFGSSLFCNFIYRDRRQSSLLPQQIKPEAGKGHPIQSSDLLHTFLSVSLGGVAYRRRSGVILFLQHGAAMPVPFLMTVPFFFLLKNKKAGHPGAVAPKCPAQNNFDNFLKTTQKSGAFFQNPSRIQKRHRLNRYIQHISSAVLRRYLFTLL